MSSETIKTFHLPCTYSPAAWMGMTLSMGKTQCSQPVTAASGEVESPVLVSPLILGKRPKSILKKATKPVMLQLLEGSTKNGTSTNKLLALAVYRLNLCQKKTQYYVISHFANFFLKQIKTQAKFRQKHYNIEYNMRNKIDFKSACALNVALIAIYRKLLQRQGPKLRQLIDLSWKLKDILFSKLAKKNKFPEYVEGKSAERVTSLIKQQVIQLTPLLLRVNTIETYLARKASSVTTVSGVTKPISGSDSAISRRFSKFSPWMGRHQKSMACCKDGNVLAIAIS